MKYFNKSKFTIDSLFNLLSVGASGVLYIIINITILKYYGDNNLGIFNQSYAIYIILSQIGVWGIHLSVQQYIPRYYKSKEKASIIISSAIFITTLTSSFFVIITYPFTNFISNIFKSESIDISLQFCLWGIILFSLNKVLMSYLNGKRMMKSFAIFSFLRFLFMFLTLCCLIIFFNKPEFITLILSIPELLLFIILLIYIFNFINFRINKEVFFYIIRHFNFGRKAFLGNVLLDINTRVDIIMLGIYVSDEKVGIYSFVLAITEGILQISVVFRNNINPIITKASILANVSEKLNILLRKNIVSFYKILGTIAFLSLILFPIGLYIIQVKDNYMTYIIIYSILISGIILSAGYQPFAMIFNQMALPHIQSLFFFILFVVNLIGNIIFIQIFDIYGAALGTACSYIAHVIFIKLLSQKYCKITI